MSPGLIYNVCRNELADILMLENVNKHRHYEACLLLPASKCSLIKARSQSAIGKSVVVENEQPMQLAQFRNDPTWDRSYR